MLTALNRGWNWALFLTLASSQLLFSQSTSKSPVSFSVGNGLGFVAADSSFSVNIRFRMQNRLGAILTEMPDGSWEVTQSEFRVRRTRLRFDGFMFNPKWTYALQLSFSRADQDWDNSGVPNVLRDAMIFYRPNKNWTFAFGQGKLPGNRQRVISSGEQQFADRSLVNATFNIDRDFGVHAGYQFHTGKPLWMIKTALSSGEGRNEGLSGYAAVNPGLCYTGRLEFLPFGAFSGKNDYSESDLQREPKPRLSLAGGWSYNENSVRTAGQLGRGLYSAVSTHTLITDLLFKYRGFSLYGEYIERSATTDPITRVYASDGSVAAQRWIFAGKGMLLQSGYLFKNNWEIAGRYARIEPMKEVRNVETARDNYSLCVSKYLRGHRFKIQSDLTYEAIYNGLSGAQQGRNLAWRFQIEMGI